MADRLPFGEIRPGARPIGSFIAPAQQQTAGAARPELLGTPSGIVQLQKGSGGSVQGYNQFEQVAQALAPFSKNLQTVMEKGITQYASSQVEAGYYRELKNQQVLSTMSLGLQQEEGAAQAASTIGQLQKTDPAAAQTLKETNPFALIGQRRAKAQLAAAAIDNVLEADVTQNAGYLATLAPGSPELVQRKQKASQDVLSRYGLTGEEPESLLYVVPQLNKAWDDFTAKHGKLFSAAVYHQTVLQTSALGVVGIQDAVTNGFTMPDGTVLKPGTPEWKAEGHRRMTYLLDSQLRLLTPDDKAKALENIRGDFAQFSGMPYVWDLITGIRVGDPKVDYDKRPTWGAAQAEELLEDRQKALSRRLQESNDQQAFVKREALQAWAKDVGSFAPGSDAQREAVLEFRKQYGGRLDDIDGFIASRLADREKLQSQLFPADPREAEQFSTAIKSLPANVWTDDPNALKNAQDRAWQIASREPTPEARNKRYEELTQEIDKAREQATKSAKDVVPGAKAATLEDLDSPEVRAIRKRQGKSSGGGLGAAIFQAASKGSSATQAVGAAGDPKLTTAANQLERLYQASMQNKINSWQASHPTQVLSPEARLNLIAEAKQEVRKSEQYGQIMKGLLGYAPAGTPQAAIDKTLQGGRYAPPGLQQSSQPLRGVSLQNTPNLPDSTVKGYAIRPVLDGASMRSELQRIGRGEGVSSRMAALAQRAGVSPYRYLQEQLKFYPEFDDSEGSLRQLLQEKAKAQQVSQSISRAQLPGALPSASGGGFGMLPVGYNPLATGGWLMSMMAPPARAIQSVFGGGGSGGNYVATTGFGYSADRRTQTLHGIQGRPGYDKNHGVGNDHVHHGAYDAPTAMALATFLKSRGWPITEFSPWGRVGSHQDPGHYTGKTFDIPVPVKDHQRVMDDINLFYSGGQVTTRPGGGQTGLATYYNGSGGSDGVAGGPTANGERYDPDKMTAAVQWSLRGKYLNRWVNVEDLDTGKTVRVWVNDVGQMGGSETSINRSDPRVIDLSPAAFRKLFGSTQRGVGRIRIVPG